MTMPAKKIIANRDKMLNALQELADAKGIPVKLYDNGIFFWQFNTIYLKFEDLKEYFDEYDDDKEWDFDQKQFTKKCGSVGCAIGLARELKIIPKHDVFEMDEMAENLGIPLEWAFSIFMNEYIPGTKNLFWAPKYTDDVTAEDMIRELGAMFEKFPVEP